MGDKIRLLWIDLSTADSDAQPDLALDDFFEIATCSRHERIARRLADEAPEVVCFNFDYPDRAGSRLVEELKRLYSSIPMFITTMQHSEELAVWAFRSRMIDFLVKPVSDEEMLRCYGVLQEICDAKRKQASRLMSKSAQAMPASILSSAGGQNSSLEPALYYVEQHFREKIPADTVAKLCGMSAFRFSRMFKEKYSIAFRDYVVRYRLREAYKMIKERNSSVTEAAYAVGFNDISYFSRMFKRHFDVPPSELNEPMPDGSQDASVTAILKLPLH
jgi:AraC-like DNA-binding protein